MGQEAAGWGRQVGERTSWEGPSLFPMGRGRDRAGHRPGWCAGSQGPSWLPELAIILDHTDICPHSGIGAPALQDWPVLLCTWSLDIWVPRNQSPGNEACQAPTCLESTFMPDSCGSHHGEGGSQVIERPEVSERAVALDVYACRALTGPCLLLGQTGPDACPFPHLVHRTLMGLVFP